MGVSTLHEAGNTSLRQLLLVSQQLVGVQGFYSTCANEAIVFVAVSVITFTEFPCNVPFLWRTDALSTVART